MQVKVKKRTLLLGLLLQLALGFRAAGQVSISPEVGLSYVPIKYGFPKYHTESTSSLLIGISGMVPIQGRWYANARVSYAFRKDLALEYDRGIIPGTIRDEYKYSDINVDFSINTKVLGWLHIGIGPSLVRRLNATYSITLILEDGSEHLLDSARFDRFNYGFNVALGAELKGALLKLDYYRQLSDDGEYQTTFSGKNRYNAVIAYPIKIKDR
jgi:hypothetical protein